MPSARLPTVRRERGGGSHSRSARVLIKSDFSGLVATPSVKAEDTELGRVPHVLPVTPFLTAVFLLGPTSARAGPDGPAGRASDG